MNNMSKLAEHIIAIANQEVDRITNLQLQKVIYFVIGDYIAANGLDSFIRDLYDEKMEAWQYGPVLRSEYFKNSIYGSMKIRRDVEMFEEMHAFDDFINNRIRESLGSLIDESHEHSKWKNNKSCIILNTKPIYYELEDFEYEFAS